jgi:hypothetical protein
MPSPRAACASSTAGAHLRAKRVRVTIAPRSVVSRHGADEEEAIHAEVGAEEPHLPA